MAPIKNFISPKIYFNKGGIDQLSNFIGNYRVGKDEYCVVFIDEFFEGTDINLLGDTENIITYYVSTEIEPETALIDMYVEKIKIQDKKISCIVGIGGGIVMDVAKAISIMLTNDGETENYQGWDLVANKPLPKIGVPTISGTGSEVSRTTVLTSPKKKQGINSVYSMFDQLILDPTLLNTVDPIQRFYTGMDCYIHSVESISGSYLNEFSKQYAEKALELCRKYFLDSGSDAELMMASMFGGYSIVYSEVGICHALSYGISHVFGYHHGEANCIVFNYLEEYYPEYVPEFKNMLKRYDISLPKDITKDISEDDLESMVNMTLLMEKPLNNALGDNWRDILTREKIRELYLKM